MDKCTLCSAPPTFWVHQTDGPDHANGCVDEQICDAHALEMLRAYTMEARERANGSYAFLTLLGD